MTGPIDQAHEQNNASIKGDGGAVGLTDNPSALRRWMVAGPEVARLIDEFQDETDSWNKPPDTRHHDQSESVQSAFVKDVQSMVTVMEDFGNPFKEDSQDLLVLDTKKIAPPAAVDALRRAHKVGQMQFESFVRERLVERTKPLEDAIHRAISKSLSSMVRQLQERSKEGTKGLKNDVGLFSRLYIGCQNRDVNLEEFFQQENQAFPPTISDGVVSGLVSSVIFLPAWKSSISPSLRLHPQAALYSME